VGQDKKRSLSGDSDLHAYNTTGETGTVLMGELKVAATIQRREPKMEKRKRSFTLECFGMTARKEKDTSLGERDLGTAETASACYKSLRKKKRRSGAVEEGMASDTKERKSKGATNPQQNRGPLTHGRERGNNLSSL